MDQAILNSICESLYRGEGAALITIVATRGSTPRKAGSKMILFPDGRTIGTIGGGCGEAEVKRQALLAFDEKSSRLYTVNMLNEAAADEGMVCGGLMEVFIQII
ncbi:MAG: XdhC family protein [Pelosinus sp.]|nr:XdhC family protein [Pelosinus sp.]